MGKGKMMTYKPCVRYLILKCQEYNSSMWIYPLHTTQETLQGSYTPKYCPPVYQFSLKLHCISKFPTEISKTNPLHTFCIHLLWGLRVSASTDMVQPSPQLNCVSGGITLSSFRSWQSNPAPLNRCKFTQCFNTVLQFLLYQENWFVAWLRDHLL
jgi:hypothetical protein